MFCKEYKYIRIQFKFVLMYIGFMFSNFQLFNIFGILILNSHLDGIF